jgi:TIR domain
MVSSTSEVSGRIFISYRREETAFPAGWIFDRLAAHFGKDQVFKDVDSIKPGDDFVEVITEAVGRCTVLLALIGDQWVSITDKTGNRRLDDPQDFVRVEIEAALSRGVRVIPILVGGTQMPDERELPPSMAALRRRQALSVDPLNFDSDTGKLLRFLEATTFKVKVDPEPGPPDAERAAAQRRQQIGQLQGYIKDSAARQDWYAVLGFSDQLAAIDPAAADPQGLATLARDEIARQAGAQRIRTATPPAANGPTAGPGAGPPPVRPKRRLRYLLAAAVVAVVVVIAVVTALTHHSPPSTTGTLPTAYQGTWQGDVNSPGIGTMAASMSLGAGSAGAEVGSFVNSTLECSGSVYFEGGTGPVYLRLITTNNPKGECVPFAYAETSVTSGGGLSFTFLQSSGVNPNEPVSNVDDGSGVLSRGG